MGATIEAMNTMTRSHINSLVPAPAPHDYERFTQREVLAAAPDFLAVAAGRPPKHAHPLVDALSLKDVAYAIALKREPKRAYDTDHRVMARGLAAPEFLQLVIDAHLPTVLSLYNGASAEYRAFTAPVPVKDFREFDSRAFDGNLDLEPLSELSEIHFTASPTPAAGSQIQLRTFARMAWLFRDWLLSDDMAAIERLFRTIAGSGARTEARLVTELLASNPDLADGQPVFNADSTVASALDETSLGLAMSKLRKAADQPGASLNLPARHLVVAAELELAANRLAHQANLQIEVSALADLPTGRWFLLPDPELHPVVGLMHLRDTSMPLVLGGASSFEIDNPAVKVRLDTNVCFLRRTGIVRGGGDL
jgi:hypothetical protein